MRGVMRKIIVIATLLAVCAICLVSCGVVPKYESDGKLSFNCKELYLSVGSKEMLIPNTIDKSASFKWSSNKPLVASVDSEGNVEAKGVGMAEITAMIDNGKKTTCKVTVSDSIVNSGMDSNPSIGLYKTIQEAVNVGGSIVVYPGVYPENVIADKPCQVKAINKVVMQGFKGTKLLLDNITFIRQEPLAATDSCVSATQSLSVKKCNFAISVAVDDAMDLIGGHAIYCGKDVSMICVVDTNISNFHTAILIEQNAADIDIHDNAVTKCKYGICVDVKGDNKMLSDYKANGTIYNNNYYNCYSATKFDYTGTNYRGNLHFVDIADTQYDKLSRKKQDKQHVLF